MTIASLVDSFKTKLGNYGEFIQPNDLVTIGIFGDQGEVLRALARKEIPSLKITKKRTLIPSSGVLEYLDKKANIVSEKPKKGVSGKNYSNKRFE